MRKIKEVLRLAARPPSEHQGMPDMDRLSFQERLALLLQRERTAREDRRLSRLLRQAKLRLAACAEDIEVCAPRGLDRSVVLRLATAIGSGRTRRS